MSRLGYILSVVADSSNKSMSCRFHDSKRLARIVTVASEADNHNQLLNCQRASNKNRHAAREGFHRRCFYVLVQLNLPGSGIQHWYSGAMHALCSNRIGLPMICCSVRIRESCFRQLIGAVDCSMNRAFIAVHSGINLTILSPGPSLVLSHIWMYHTISSNWERRHGVYCIQQFIVPSTFFYMTTVHIHCKAKFRKLSALRASTQLKGYSDVIMNISSNTSSSENN